MDDNNLKSVSDQYISFVTTPDNKTKAMYKQAGDLNNANLIVFREREVED
jgi:hypothetical protein